MPLCVESPFALSRAHFFFFFIQRTFPTARTSACCSRIRTSCNGPFSQETLPPKRASTRGAHHRLQKKTQKTLVCRRNIAPVDDPSTAKGTPKHRDVKENRSLYGFPEESHRPPQESHPAAGHHRPPDHSISSMVLSPPLLPPLKRFSELPPADQAFYLIGSITFMVCGAFIALLAVAIPTLNAMRKAALSLERLADTARQELPGTMAAIRLSGMEISDLTLELSDLGEEISESVRSSARAMRAAEVGIRRMGSAAASQTLSMLQEHASMPVEAVKPVVANAAETTRNAMTQAHKAVLGLANMPVLSKWIQKKKIEEQMKIEEDMDSESSDEFNKQDETGLMVDS
eukprot:c19844_g1_i2 orf=78-1112(+)